MKTSNCCGATLLHPDIEMCSACKEHCATEATCDKCGIKLLPKNVERGICNTCIRPVQGSVWKADEI